MVNSSRGQTLHFLEYFTTTVRMSYLPDMEAVVVSITVLFNYSLYTFFLTHKKNLVGLAHKLRPQGESKKGEREDKKHWLEERGSP